jgi:hypothetical protein
MAREGEHTANSKKRAFLETSLRLKVLTRNCCEARLGAANGLGAKQ